MKLKKILAISLATMMTVTMFTGCGSNSTDTVAKDSDNSSAKTEEKQEGEKQKLTVSVWDNETTPQFKAVTDAFMKEHEDVEVELVDTQADEYDNKLTVMLSAGDADPDVIFVKNAEMQASMKTKNQILNMDDYIKKDGVDFGIYNGAAEELEIDGSSYTMPFRKDWYVLYYNKDLFDKAGVPYPSDDMTWSEYEELARKMTSGEGNSKVYGSHLHTWMGLVANWGLQDGKNTLMSEDYTFLKPYYEQALGMQDDGIIQSYANLKTGSIHYASVFEQQQCAMLPMGTWFIGTLIADKDAGNFDFNWGVTRIPHPEGVEAGNTVGSVTPIAINAKTDTKDLAWEYVKFVSGEKGAEALAEVGILPAVESDNVTEKLSDMKGLPEGGEVALTTKGFVFDRPLDEKMPAVRKVIEEEHDLIMIGEEDVDTGIKNMNDRAKEAREE